MTYDEFRQKCDNLGLTNYQVSEYSGISKATLSQWKNGNSKPSLKTIKRLEAFLNNFDTELINYYVSYPAKTHIATEYAMQIAAKKEKIWIESFGIRINDGHPVELTEIQFSELRKNTEIFANTWLKYNKLI